MRRSRSHSLKLEGLSEYDVRRPLTYTETNLLGLINLTTSSAWYFGDVFGRPSRDGGVGGTRRSPTSRTCGLLRTSRAPRSSTATGANFTYSPTVQGGHSNDAVINFLSIRKGYCEQFSGTFATMARSLGLPTRVVVGFTEGQLRSDGLYHITGSDAHAWDEVCFDGYGWVLFDPTPGRGAPGAEQHTAAAAQQAAP